MKVAVCSSGNDLSAPVDPRFGRCASFVIVDSDTMEFSAEPNPGAMMGQGAGIQAAQTLAGRGVEAVVAGNFGPNAFQSLSAAGISIYLCAVGTVAQAVEALKSGALQQVGSATVSAHYGMGSAPGQTPGFGAGPGMGSGMGPGMGGGMGGGRGMGRGGGRGRGRGGR